MKQVVEIELDIPEGYTFDRFDFAETGEAFLSWETNEILRVDWRTNAKRLIVKPVPQWTTPTLEDIDAADEPIPCRVRDGVGRCWQHTKLHGIAKFGELSYVTTAGACWRFCEIQK